MHLRAAMTAGALIASLLAPTVPARAADGTSDQVAITKSRAERLAKAGVLTKNDLRTFRSEVNEEDSPEYVAAQYECLGTKIPKFVAKNPGRTFEKRALTITSQAAVVNTKKAARADFRAVMTKRGDTCIAKAFRLAFEQEGATVDSVKVRRFAVSVPGADLAFGQRFVMRGSFDAFSFVVIGLNINALVGQTELAVGPTRYNGREPNLAQAQSLLAKVVERVRAV